MNIGASEGEFSDSDNLLHQLQLHYFCPHLQEVGSPKCERGIHVCSKLAFTSMLIAYQTIVRPRKIDC